MSGDTNRRRKKGVCSWTLRERRRKQFKGFPPVKTGAQLKDVVDTRRVLSRKVAEGAKTAMARLVAEGYQDPDLRNGFVRMAGRVSRRWPYLQLISLGAWKKWAIWILGIKNTFLQADGFARGVYVRAPREWISKDDRRVDAPVAFHRSLRKYLVNSAESSSSVGLRLEASSFDARLFSPGVERRSWRHNHTH